MAVRTSAERGRQPGAGPGTDGDGAPETPAGRPDRRSGGRTDGRSDGRSDGVARLLSLDPDDPSWVDARPFRAHLRHLMAVGSLEVVEAAVLLGLPTRAVSALLEGRGGRPTRRISAHTARRLLLVSGAEVRGLRWCLAPAQPAVAALARLRDSGCSDDEIALAVGFGVAEVRDLVGAARCSRLLTVRLVGLARSLPGAVDDQDPALLVPAA